ncbi:MAG: 30S ribosomal protein S20 [Candidatus Cloacimonadota bacterium]|nr:MAG: 30S ribosomal protein S20 [Candidatus Cloacimonadota bacterium]
MPHHKSCEKRLRSDANKRERNKFVKKTIRTSIKNFKALDSKAEMEKLLPNIYALLDKAVKKGIIHKNNASRRKSRIAKLAAQQTQ